MTAEQSQIALVDDTAEILAQSGAEGDCAFFAEQLLGSRVKPDKGHTLRLSMQPAFLSDRRF